MGARHALDCLVHLFCGPFAGNFQAHAIHVQPGQGEKRHLGPVWISSNGFQWISTGFNGIPLIQFPGSTTSSLSNCPTPEVSPHGVPTGLQPWHQAAGARIDGVPPGDRGRTAEQLPRTPGVPDALAVLGRG